MIRLNIVGNPEVDGTAKGTFARTNWDSFSRCLPNNMVYPLLGGDMRSELKLETVVEDFNSLIGAYGVSCSAKTVASWIE